MEFIVGIVLGAGLLLYIAGKSGLNLKTFFSDDEEFKKTLLIGLYHRFKRDDNDKAKENPFNFEIFVARVVERYFGGNATVTQCSGDGGIDIIHKRKDGTYLGQVKCYFFKDFVDMVAVQRIHSQMVKQNLKGGFVVTTSDYTPSAIQYAREVNVQLYNGAQLVDMLLNVPNVDSLTEKVRFGIRNLKWASRSNRRTKSRLARPIGRLNNSATLFSLNARPNHRHSFKRILKAAKRLSPIK